MSAHIMTAFQSKMDSCGMRKVRATYGGPTLVAPATGYDAGGSVCNLASKPAAATPVSDAASTSMMLYSTVENVEIQLPAALENTYRCKYVYGAAKAPALGLVQVFTPPVVTVAHTLTLAEVTALGAFTGPLPVAAVALVCPADHYIVGGRVTHTTTWAAPAATAIYVDITSITGASDLVDGTTATFNGMTPANLNVPFTTAGAVGSETVFGPGTAATLYPAGDILIDVTSVGGNLDTFTAGEAEIELFCVSRLVADNFEGWIEVAGGTDLTALTFTVEASGL